jgi:hypothetical protein
VILRNTNPPTGRRATPKPRHQTPNQPTHRGGEPKIGHRN